jgi:hypothetical protein
MRENIEKRIRELYPGDSYDDQQFENDKVVFSEKKAHSIFSAIASTLKLGMSFAFPNDYEHCFTSEFSASGSDEHLLTVRLSQYCPCFYYSFKRRDGGTCDSYSPPGKAWREILAQVVALLEKQGITDLQPDSGLFEEVGWLNAGHSLMARGDNKVTVFNCLFIEI